MALAKKKKALGSVSAVKKLKDLVANKPANSVVMTFTPVVAEYILDNMNVGNRPQKPSRIVRYAADMANDNWSVTGESIKFGADGKLKDGQNRLAACVRSNSSFKSYAVFGIDPDSFSQMDVGAKRSDSDVLSIMGVPNAEKVSAIIRMLMSWETNKTETSGSHRMPADVRAYYEDRIDADLMQRAVKLSKAVYMTTQLPRSITGALYYLAVVRGHEKKAEQFMQDLEKGFGKGLRSPVRYVLQTIMKWKSEQQFKVTHHHYSVVLSRAWHSFKNNRACTREQMIVTREDTMAVV
jgi:hypothetical protein